jgi:DNA-binding transcriptional ArsR family regulator
MQANDKFTSPSPQDMQPVFRMHAELCKALANQHRLAMLYALTQNEMSVGDLAATLDLPLHNVSQHLRVLKERKLVRSRKEAQTVYYSITNLKFIQGCTLIRQALIEQHRAEGDFLAAAEILDAIEAAPLPGSITGR